MKRGREGEGVQWRSNRRGGVRTLMLSSGRGRRKQGEDKRGGRMGEGAGRREKGKVKIGERKRK